MLAVTRFYCRSFDLDHLDLFWETANFDGAEDVRRYSFYILRSESPGGPWDPIGGPLIDQYLFRDVSPALLHKWRNLYYKLRVVDTLLQEEAEVGPTAQESEPDLIALEIMRQEDLLFREFVGRKCWLFPVRTFGPRCVCFDTVMGRRTRSNCPTCFDVGFLGGYLSPLECYIQLDPAANNPTITPLMEQQNTNTSARLLSFPPVKPKDILVETENRRWRVATVNTTNRLRAVVHQELVLHEIPRGDVEFKLPVNVGDLRQLVPAAERNYTNKQHLDGGDSLADIVALFGGRPRGAVR